jgi:hypothetical protein
MRHTKRPQKKGPQRMRDTSKDLARQSFEAEVDRFLDKVLDAVEESRARMTDEQREKADQEAEAILKSANSGPRRSSQTA